MLAVAVLIVWGGSTSIYTVQPEGQSVVKRFGKVVAIKPPGLHFKLPFGIDTQTFVPTARAGVRLWERGRRADQGDELPQKRG